LANKVRAAVRLPPTLSPTTAKREESTLIDWPIPVIFVVYKRPLCPRHVNFSQFLSVILNSRNTVDSCVPPINKLVSTSFIATLASKNHAERVPF